jgi:hypothetical protein
MKGAACNDSGGTVCDGNGHCTSATCTDGYQDGDETDVDCGGSCPRCADGKKCLVVGDCSDGVCSGAPKTCQAPTCSDGVPNGEETDVDCGGAPCDGAGKACADGKKCMANADCANGNCFGSAPLQICVSCGDGSKDGDETDVDCGGSCTSAANGHKTCAVGKGCLVPADCTIGFCNPSKQCGCTSNADCAGGEICCGNLCRANDPANCGACGHGCQGGACSGQVCQPVTIATGQSLPYAIVVDANNVYWTNSGSAGSVMKCAIDDCANTTKVLASNVNDAVSITVDFNNVYWTAYDGIFSCATAGCNGTPTKLCSAATCATGPNIGKIAVDTTNVYWTVPYGSNGLVMKCATSGCGTSPTTLASGLIFPDGIAVDGANLYWTNQSANGSVMRCALSNCGGTQTALASGAAYPGGITIDQTTVYWLTADTGGNGNLMKCAKGGCTGGAPTTLAGPGGDAVVVDAANAYWNDGMEIYRVALTGGAVTTVATSPSTVSIAQDAVALYWTTGFSGTVMKVAK